MENKTNELLLPGLFDLSQDMVEYVPSDLVNTWLKSKRTPALARRLLQKNKVHGISVSSDTSGLSRISQSKNLFEVMAMISKPKELIYSYGKAIGGRSVGIWAADNTQMFYPADTVSPDEVVNMLYHVNQEILRTCHVKVGFGMHHGTFYNIGNGFYGVDADKIEDYAENHVDGGTISLSTQTISELNKNDFVFTDDPNDPTHQFKLLEKSHRPKPQVDLKDYKYPIPYTRSFHEDLHRLYDKFDSDTIEQLRHKYSQNKIVVLIERERTSETTREEQLLNDLTLYGVMGKTAIKLLIDYEGKRIKTVGNLGIYTFSDPVEALEFTNAYQIELQSYQIRSKAALAKGEVLIFELEQRHRDIAGNPVNVASKIAQDLGQFDSLYLTEDLFENLKHHELTKGFECSEQQISNITLKYYHRPIISII